MSSLNESLKGCVWPKSGIELHYHDTEWGTPLHDDQQLFEFLILDGFQAGLSWATILNKRENFRAAFDNFDAESIANYDDRKRLELMANPGIIRNRLKIDASVINARLYLDKQSHHGSFDRYIWQFTDGQTINNNWDEHSMIPATSPESDAMSRQLKKDGFKFVGSTICYAFMQAAGMVNDHLITCPRHKQVTELAKQGRGIRGLS